MNAVTFIHRNSLMALKPQMTSQRLLAQAQVVGTVVGLAGGLTSGLAGALLIVAGWLASDKGAQQWLSTTGSILLFLVIPLIMLGACCMDWMEKDKPQHRSKVVCHDDDDEW